MGLNFDIQYRFHDVDTYHKVGDALAPKRIWEQVVGDSDRAIGLEQLRIIVQDGKRGEELKSPNSKTISVQRGGNAFTIRMSYNDHHELLDLPKGILATDAAMEILREQWQEQLQVASNTFSRIVELAVSEK